MKLFIFTCIAIIISQLTVAQNHTKYDAILLRSTKSNKLIVINKKDIIDFKLVDEGRKWHTSQQIDSINSQGFYSDSNFFLFESLSQIKDRTSASQRTGCIVSTSGTFCLGIGIPLIVKFGKEMTSNTGSIGGSLGLAASILGTMVGLGGAITGLTLYFSPMIYDTRKNWKPEASNLMID